MAQIKVRVRRPDGSATGLLLDYDTAAADMRAAWEELAHALPWWLSGPLDAFLFALRHGPLPRQLREAQLPAMDKGSGNGGAVEALIRLLGDALSKGVAAESGGDVLDISQDEFTALAFRSIRHVPDLDEPPQLAAPQADQQEGEGHDGASHIEALTAPSVDSFIPAGA